MNAAYLFPYSRLVISCPGDLLESLADLELALRTWAIVVLRCREFDS
jgi:hypothetical protein